MFPYLDTNMATRKVFVCGGTGTQGGAVARRLRALDWEVRTTTRNTDSKPAQALSAIGVKLLHGTWQDEAALTQAMTGCDLLFLNVAPDFELGEVEFDTGMRVLRAAKAAHIRNVVYSSAIVLQIPPGCVLAKSGDQKRLLEKQVMTAGFEHWTILQPGYFMTNLLSPKVQMMLPGAAESGVLTFAYRPDTLLPLIDHENIADFVVAAFRDPCRFHAKVIELTAENVTVDRAMETIRQGTGRNVRPLYMSPEETEKAAATNVLIAAQALMRDMVGRPEDSRGWGIKMTTFEEFVAREREAFHETYRLVGNVE